MNTHIGLAPWIVAAYVQLTVIAWVSVDVRCRSHYGIAEDGCNGSTQIRYYQIIGECLKYAVRKDHITMNPMTKVDRPKKNKFRASYYTKDEATTLLDCAKGNPLYMPIVLGIFYGLRRSEAVGLQWSSIDFENNLIHIDHKAYEQVINGKAKVFLSSEMKTESSLRTLPLIPFVREELLSHKAQQEEYKKSFRKGYCKDWSDCVCVFPTGEIIPPGYISSNFKRFLTENNLRPIRYHDLRHSCASMLVAQGVPMKQIQLWMGWAIQHTQQRLISIRI
jgi:integrase